MADQTQRLEIATVRAEVGSNILYRFSNDAADAPAIPTESGEIQNIKQVALGIQSEAAEKISIATAIYPTVAAGLAATPNQSIFLVQSGEEDEIYTVWKNEAGTAVNTGKTALSATAIQTALDASNEAAQAAEDAADVAITRTARYLAPSATPPVVRDEGLPLEIGDVWFNTFEQTEYRYTDQGWRANDSLQAIADLEVRMQDYLDPDNGTGLLGWDGAPLNDHLNQSKKLANFDALRNYAGEATRFTITGLGISGDFYVDSTDTTSADNNGVVIVDYRGRRIKRDFLGAVRPEMFGAKSNGNINQLSDYFSTLAEAQQVYPHAISLDCSIDWAATQAAVNYVRTLPIGGTVVFSGRPVISHGIDCHPTVPVELCWEEGCTVLTTLLGAGSILFRGTHPTTPSIRGKRLVLTNPDIAFHSSIPGSAVGCLFVEQRYASNFKIQGNRGALLHYRNNSVLRLSGLFNCDAGPVSIWGGGIQKPWKVLPTARYTVASGATALSSSVDVFDATDVGKVLVLQGSGLSQRFTIASFVDARNVTVTAAAVVTFTSIGGNFETIRGSIASGSTTLTMEKACLDSTDVGRVVYVLNARTSFPSPAVEPLRATITAVTSSTVCTLSVAASVTAASTTIVFSPGVELFGEDDASSNDLVFDGLHTEEMRGTCLVVTRAGNLSLTNLKLHALNNYYTTSATQHRAVFAAVSGHITGDFEGTCNTPSGDVHVSGQAGMLTFDKMTGVMANDGCLVYAENNSAGAIIKVGDWNINNPSVATRSLDNAFRITGSGSLYQEGNIVAYAVNYTRPDIVKRKRVFGLKNPPTFAGQLGVASDSGAARIDLIAAGPGNSPFLVGTAYGGSLDSPTSAVDFQTSLSLRGAMYAGSSVLDGAGILFRVRAPSGSDASSDMVFSTRAAGTYSSRWSMTSGGDWVPSVDNGTAIGSSAFRISQLWAGTATINTSDERYKEDIQGISDTVLDAWSQVEFCQYRFRDAVLLKQEDARWHFGVLAQRIEEVFRAHGLNARDFGLLCYDEWPEEKEVIESWDAEYDGEGILIREAGSHVVSPHRQAGSRYGIRYEEALALESALMRRATQRLDERMAALESAATEET